MVILNDDMYEKALNEMTQLMNLENEKGLTAEQEKRLIELGEAVEIFEKPINDEIMSWANDIVEWSEHMDEILQELNPKKER